jgi:hypothetical protein
MKLPLKFLAKDSEQYVGDILLLFFFEGIIEEEKTWLFYG